jgi:hypothetical protein
VAHAYSAVVGGTMSIPRLDEPASTDRKLIVAIGVSDAQCSTRNTFTLRSEKFESMRRIFDDR